MGPRMAVRSRHAGVPMGRMRRAILAVACGFALAGSARIGAASTSMVQRGTPGEPTVWNAANQPQHDAIGLQCRGGAGYEFKSIGFKTEGAATRVAIAMTFAPNGTAAGSRNEKLQSGTCAPSDRPLRATEPRQLHFITASFSQPFIGSIDVTSKAAEYHPDVRSMADYLRDPAHFWTFHAVDTQRGYFDVTT